MHKLITFFLLLAIAEGISAQNLVRNGGFEEKKYCPTSYNTSSLKTLEGWKQPSEATPDHFDLCNTNKAGVPKNIAGSQPAFEGNAYAGLVTYTSTKRNYREYIQTKLTRKLGAGEMVCVEFWVSTGDLALYVTDGIGAYFTQSAVRGQGQKLIEADGQVVNPRLHIVDYTDQWVKLSDTFTAKGGEQYLTIGNFKNDKQINKLKRTALEGADESSNWAYIYVDEVNVYSVKTREECSCVNDKIRGEVHDPPLQLEEMTEISLETVYFAFDDSTLTEQAKVKLEETSAMLRRNKYMIVRVNGHTDVIGREGHNVKLSEHRARAVMNYLKYLGIDPVRLQLEWYGSDDPAADNDTAEGRAQNRRVDFAVLRRNYVLVED
ncbi:MAG: OmpA family protein [Flavobacteriales bacterium]|nr:OmpA family protein [Flavobacteriales bacterium]